MDNDQRKIVVTGPDEEPPVIVEAVQPDVSEVVPAPVVAVDEHETITDNEPLATQAQEETLSGDYTAMPDADNSTTNPTDTEQTEAPQLESPATVTPNAKPRRKKFVLIGAVASVVLLAGGAATALLIKPTEAPLQSNASTSSQQVSKKVAKMGVAVTLVDGVAEYTKNLDVWQPLTTDSALSEGDSVRTANSRVVLTFDDGSALRLDANSSVKLDDLTAENVKIAHTSGTTYSRVVTSERKYTVAVADTEYTALGTAFATTNDANEKGVQVYQSSVKVKGVTDPVSEGKQYYSASADAARKAKITNVNIDTAAESEFLQWNAAEDEKQQQFKEKLGMLLAIRQRVALKVKQTEADAQKREQEAVAAKAKQEAEQKAAEEEGQTNDDPELVTRGTLKVTVSGSKINWTYTGKAVYGYKLVYSKTSSMPTFDVDSAVYYVDKNTTSGVLPKELIKGAAYKVRVCAYTGQREAEPCVDYSNLVTVIKS